MITIKTPAEIEKMRTAGKIVAGALGLLESMIAPGVTTGELDRAARKFIGSKGAKPSFLGYKGYPAAINASVNEEVIHGIPGQRKLAEGDIVSIDIGAFKNGYHGDAARTFPVGSVSDTASRLIKVTKEAFYEGLKLARAGGHLYDISSAIQKYVESNGFSVVRDFIGHGIGKRLHEPPDVPNYKPVRGRGTKLLAGMTIAVEPMVNGGSHGVIILDDGWTVITEDRTLSAHYENTIFITGGEPEILTAL